MMQEKRGAECGHGVIVEVVEAVDRDSIDAYFLVPREFLETIRL